MVIVMTERVGCPSLEVQGLSDVQKCILSWQGPWVLVVQAAQGVCRGGEHRARPKALGRQEGVTCFCVTLIIQPTFLHKWFCRSEGLETLSRKVCSNRSSSKAYLPNNIYGLAGESQQPKMSCFLRSGREYALNFKGAWNQMDSSCCAKKKKKNWGDGSRKHMRAPEIHLRSCCYFKIVFQSLFLNCYNTASLLCVLVVWPQGM